MGASFGYDTTSAINSFTSTQFSTLTSRFGAYPSFWMRYCASHSGINQFETSPISECRALWDSGARFVSFVQAPNSGNISTTGTTGHNLGVSDATAFANAVESVYFSGAGLSLPSDGGHILVYLDQEPGVNLSTNYWNGWQGVINNWIMSGHTQKHLYAGLYCNPGGSETNCSTVTSIGGCHSIWTDEPDVCSYCQKTFAQMTWGPSECSSNVPYTFMWQYAQNSASSCSACAALPANVDINMADPSTTASHMFNLPSRP